jgi:hypothetical protein
MVAVAAASAALLVGHSTDLRGVAGVGGGTASLAGLDDVDVAMVETGDLLPFAGAHREPTDSVAAPRHASVQGGIRPPGQRSERRRSVRPRPSAGDDLRHRWLLGWRQADAADHHARLGRAIRRPAPSKGPIKWKAGAALRSKGATQRFLQSAGPARTALASGGICSRIRRRRSSRPKRSPSGRRRRGSKERPITHLDLAWSTSRHYCQSLQSDHASRNS